MMYATPPHIRTQLREIEFLFPESPLLFSVSGLDKLSPVPVILAILFLTGSGFFMILGTSPVHFSSLIRFLL